jgi:hypothetical protein
MIPAIIFAVIVVVVIPVGFLMSTSIGAAAIGALLKTNAERDNAGSELLDTNY